MQLSMNTQQAPITTPQYNFNDHNPAGSDKNATFMGTNKGPNFLAFQVQM
jgi:hypothetical protein